MGGKKSSKEDVNMSSAESVRSSDDDDEQNEEDDYNVERVVDKRTHKGKVSLRLFTLLFIVKSTLRRLVEISLNRHLIKKDVGTEVIFVAFSWLGSILD